MSMNLHLACINYDGSIRDRCDLFQTPTAMTNRILDGEHGPTQSPNTVMHRYFAWVDKFFGKNTGSALDHELEVAMFLVKHPGASWYSG